MEKLGHREAKFLVRGPTAKKRMGQELSPRGGSWVEQVRAGFWNTTERNPSPRFVAFMNVSFTNAQADSDNKETTQARHNQGTFCKTKRLGFTVPDSEIANITKDQTNK